MAELSLGLTKTVVEGALSQIQWAIDEEGKLKEGVQQDLEFITSEFQIMQSFLKVANKERAKKNEVVRVWMRQLRELAFDVEDWVEFVAHLEMDKSLCSCWWRLVPSWAVPSRDLDVAAVEMKRLKARVNEMSQRNTRYNIFNSDDSGCSPGMDIKTVMSTIPDSSSTAFQLLRHVWRDDTDILRDVGSLQNLIIREFRGDELQVVWLWGRDDRYASYDIHKAYHDPEICQWFNRRAWVKITRPFKLEAFLKTLLAQLLFVGSSHQSRNGTTRTELIQHVTMEQRYLVVLEQVSDLVEWNTIRMYLPDNKKGSRIVVTTQNLRNAIFCTRVPYLVSELRRFSDGRPSICAFYEKGASQSDSDMDRLIGKIKRGGVISVYGDGPGKSSVVKKSYLSIMKNQGVLDGVRFYELRWVPVLSDGRPFSLMDFLRRMLLDLDAYGFYDGGLQELFHIFGGSVSEDFLFKGNDEDLIKRSCELLHDSGNCLLVIDGLENTKDWDDLRKSTILPDEATKCCVIVVTDDESVARYCIDGNEDLLVHVSEEVHVSLPRKKRAIDWMRSISDPHLTERRLLYDGLINDCITGGSPPVASVWGIAGVGKSTLVKWSYYKKMFDPEEFSFYCWVDVPHPFSLAELSLNLLREFFSDYISQDKETAMISILEGDRDPIQECRLLVQQHKKWLLVLDGLCSTDEWDTIDKALQLSQPTHGSRTIVITNEQRIAMHCVNKNDRQVISVQGLEADEALNLFEEKIHKKNIENDGLQPSNMERVSELSKIIMAKCGGLPKVIDAVAAYYNMMSFDKQTYSKLKDINDNFMHILEGIHSLRGLFSWMQQYLESCKDYLKPCIFYLPVFPIGHNIRERRLIMRWLAEGYIRDTSGGTLQIIISRLLSELWEFSMFQDQPSSKPAKIQVNGFLHEYINSRPMEDNLVFAPEGSCSMWSQRAGGQHLTIRADWKRDINVFRSTDLSRLRSLTVFGECKPFMFDPKEIKTGYVRVLDLEDALCVTNDDLKNIVEVFPRLKFLSLRDNKEITRLPPSLGSLRQLETLDVRHTSVTTLPKAILKLQKLLYVRAGTIHSAPWDEGGIMVPYQTAKTEEINGNAVPAQDGTTFAPEEDAAASSAAALLAPAEDTATTVAVAPSDPAEDGTTFVPAPSTPPENTNATAVAAPWVPTEDGATFAATPLTHAEYAGATVAAAQPEPAEDSTTFAALPLRPGEDGAAIVTAAPSVPAEVAATPSAAGSEDIAITGTAPLSPAEIGATVAAALLVQTEDVKTVATPLLARDEDHIIVAADLITQAQGTATVQVAPSALVEDTTVVADLTAPAEDAAIVAPTLSTRPEDTTSLAANPTAAVEDTIIVAPVPSTLATIVAAGPPALSEDVTSVSAAPMAPSEDTCTPAAAQRSRRPHAFVPRWLSKLGCQSQSCLDDTNNGVEVPAGFGKLTTIHSLGFANVGPGNNSVILKELHQLTLLQRISVCGINPDNIHQFFDAIKGLNHLRRLTVGLDKNRNGLFPSLDETIAQPPKTLDYSLKLLGHVRILPSSWIKEFANVSNLDFEVTLQEQDDMQVTLDHLIHRTNGSMKRLCIKPTQHGELRIGINDERKRVRLRLGVLEIVCTTNLHATIGNIGVVNVLRVECSTGSSLKLSGLQRIRFLKEVWLKGSCSDVLKQDLQRQLDQHPAKDKPVLKVLQRRSS